MRLSVTGGSAGHGMLDSTPTRADSAVSSTLRAGGFGDRATRA
jgi:hypothetical protein